MTARLRPLCLASLLSLAVMYGAAGAQDIPSPVPPAPAAPPADSAPAAPASTPAYMPGEQPAAPIVRPSEQPAVASPPAEASPAPAGDATGVSTPPNDPVLTVRPAAPADASRLSVVPAASNLPPRPGEALPSATGSSAERPAAAPAAADETSASPEASERAFPPPSAPAREVPGREVAAGPAEPPAVGGALLDKAWSLLSDNAAAGKNPNDRIQALAALGSMGTDDHAARLISDAFTSKDVDVRLAAVLAATQTRNPRLLPRLKEALDDPDPQVAYTAASALWKNHEHDGEDLLIAIAEGDRKPNENLMAGSRRKASEELHNPKLMATQGLEAGAGFAFGPAGFGVKAIMYAKGQGGALARAEAVDLLAQSHTEQVHQTLVDCLVDKEAAVRASCAKGLGAWPGGASARLLGPMLDDNKLPVRLMAAASYIRVERGEATRPRRF